MFEVTFANLNDPHVHASMRKLSGASKYPTSKAAYHVSRVVKMFDQEARESAEILRKLLDKHKIPIDAQGKFDVPDDKLEAWKKDYAEFSATKAKIAWDKIPVDFLPEGLTPGELVMIDSVIAE